MRSTERMLYDSIKRQFPMSGNIVFIEEHCAEFSCSGAIYILAPQKGKIYFNRYQKNSTLKVANTDSFKDHFYDEIIDVLKKDSLPFYVDLDRKTKENEEVICWLRVASLKSDKTTESVKEYDFNFPLHLQGSLNKRNRE
jgi:hypothetical protein